MKEPIPVFFSCSNLFVPQVAMSIRSLINCASPDREYHIFVFHNSITSYNEKKVVRMQTPNVKITFRNIHEVVKDQPFYINRAGLSKETYFRIFAVEFLKAYKKLIYLDSDVILLRDIADLYDEDISGCVLGAVWDYACYGSLRYIEDDLKIPIDHYFNAGVMVIDTEGFLNMKIREQCIGLLEHGTKPRWLDQDLLNLVCWKYARLLDARWNFQCHVTFKAQEKKSGRLRQILSRTMEEHFIVHYAGVDRPWTKPQTKFSEFFWETARQTEFYEELVYRNTCRGEKKTEQLFERYCFPFERIPKGSHVVVYGMGKVGTAFFRQNQVTNYCNIDCFADRNHQKLAGGPIRVVSPESLKSNAFDFVIVAIEDEGIRNGIVEFLKEAGVLPEKIVAENPQII